MELLTAARGFNGASQTRPDKNCELQEVVPLLRVVFEPVPGRSLPFSSVATSAGCHEIPWGVVTAFYERLHVVDGQLIGGEHFGTIHTAESIAAEYRNAPVVSCR